jgi:hypothetical protein
MQSIQIESYLNNCFVAENYIQLAKLQSYIPQKSISEYKITNRNKIRERIFSIETTLLGMLVQAGQEDKSKQNAVVILGKLHEDRRKRIETDRKKIMNSKIEEIEILRARGEKKQGRPQKRFLVIQKSKEKDISLYPSSYDEATIRFPDNLLKDIFTETTNWYRAEKGEEDRIKWKGKDVYVVDGTTFKTQDTKSLREYFDCYREKTNQPLPVGRMEGLVNLYGGGLVAVEIDKYTSSEGKMFKKLFNKIPPGTVVLADDLYSKFGYFSYCKNHEIDLITQKKTKEEEEILRNITENEKIVKWKRGKNRKSVLYDNTKEMEESIMLRKIEIINPEDPAKKITIYTTLLDEIKYPSTDIISIFFKRWDIEISFRQIKSILKMEYLRGKTVEMVIKEIYAHLILYNIIRRMLGEDKNFENETFSPSGSEIQVGSTMAKGPYVDKRGRSYYRWNAGRRKKTFDKK